MLDLLLFSNSTNSGSGYLEHAHHEVAQFLEGVTEVLFVPYALADHDAYTSKVGTALAVHGVRTVALHDVDDLHAALQAAEAIFVGGGNTFRLVSTIQRLGLADSIASAVRTGTKYMAASAGTNIASPTIRTTNDMPIVEPLNFTALNLVPFQINPHYLDADPGGSHAGESREVRITEFLEENDVAVLGLREGTHLRVQRFADPRASTAHIGGSSVDATKGPAILFRRGAMPHEVSDDVSWMLDIRADFDTRPLA